MVIHLVHQRTGGVAQEAQLEETLSGVALTDGVVRAANSLLIESIYKFF